MAKKPASRTPSKPAATRTTTTTSSTAVRNSPVPKPARPAAVPQPLEITHDMVAFRAWEISQSSECGSEFDNWVRAEHELRARFGR